MWRNDSTARNRNRNLPFSMDGAGAQGCNVQNVDRADNQDKCQQPRNLDLIPVWRCPNDGIRLERHPDAVSYVAADVRRQFGQCRRGIRLTPLAAAVSPLYENDL